jgi:hypothetical protein
MHQHRVCASVLGALTLLLALPVPAQTAPVQAAAPAEAPQAVAARADTSQADNSPPALQGLQPAPAQVVVSGRRPGPGVWKVSKGNHVMWVFGVYSPLPRNIEWDAGRVERLLAQSQVLLAPPSASAHVGLFKGLTLLPQLPRLIGIQKNPDGATLQEVLPAEVYAHWTLLKEKYIGDAKDVERLRPVFAAQRLQAAGRDKAGLANGSAVRERIFQIAKANKVKVVQSGFELKLDNVGKAITAFKEAPLNDAACLARTLDSLEQDLGALQQRADAWANGNIAEIEGLDYTTQAQACDEAILGSTAVEQTDPAFRSMHERLRATWLAAAEQAMAENASTFALLEMKDVFDPKGYLGALRAKGYTVESPK